MKKSVKCEFFGDNQYMYFDIERLMQLEKMLNCSIFEIASQGRLSMSFVLNGCMVGMQQHFRMKPEEWSERLQEVFESGRTVVDIGSVILEAILSSGIFGKPEEPDEKKALKKAKKDSE